MKYLFFAVALLLCVSCADLKKHDLPTPATEETVEPSKTFQVLEAERIPKVIDPLTGYFVDEAIAGSRPVAVVINNHSKARPQSGIGQAAIYYEVLAEGNITRIVAVFHNFDAQKIGPVRSARDYFVDFAMDYDAIFVHHGGSPQGYAAIESLGIADLDGMKLAQTFWRDQERVNIPGMYEHSSYTGEELIRSAQEQFEFRQTIREGLHVGFGFYTSPTELPNSTPAERISVPFGSDYGSSFEYNNGLYYKFIEGEPQIDAETEEQLAVNNIIIQKTNMTVIPGDDAGRRDVDIVGGGDGFLISRGGYTHITWEKALHESPTRWYTQSGETLTLNPGKTWICVVSPDTDVTVEGAVEDIVEGAD
ncbi:MAG: DUF3048 domain-containing protein [Clostridiales bacterium]|jgi:hypothetical protein|nr:DUF3048 domain-containing protein [Clostridiales bacterium]